jgi:carboxyl-terminal processing protease
MSRIGITALAALFGLAGLVGGLWLGGHPNDLPGLVRDAFVQDDRALHAEIIDTINDNYYKPVDEKKLEESSLKGIVSALHDPFSHYLSPKEAKQLGETLSGAFEGVGMGVEKDRRGLQVLNVFPDSPASHARIRKGDVITAVNGKSIAGESSQVATTKIKGRPGTYVRLEVLTPDTKRRRSIRVRRERIEVPVARGRVVDRGGRKLGVVQLLTFSSGAHGLLREQVRKVLSRGAQGLVLDLRGNGGGLLTEGVLVASTFIEDGKIVSVRGRHRHERTEDAVGSSIGSKLPVVVLVDRGSASASEIVTGALRDRKRATVVGTRTFGKGLVQEVEPLSNGGKLDITVANYYLPNGETITKKGIKPQVRARDNPRTRRDEALPVALDTLVSKVR